MVEDVRLEAVIPLIGIRNEGFNVLLSLRDFFVEGVNGGIQLRVTACRGVCRGVIDDDVRDCAMEFHVGAVKRVPSVVCLTEIAEV